MSWRNLIEGNSTLGGIMKLRKGFHEEWELIFDHFLTILCHFGELFLVHSNGEWSLSLLVNQFQGSWIPFQVVLWRGHSGISWEINKGVLFSVWMSIQLNSQLCPHSLIPSSPFPTLSFDGALVGVILAPCWAWLMTKILVMMYESVISSTYSI